MINQTFQILIPTINRVDLLNSSLEFYLQNFPNTIIRVLDNGNQQILEHDRIDVLKSTENLGVAGSWNELLSLCFLDSDFGIVLNDDIRLLSNENELLLFCENCGKNTFYFYNDENRFQSFLLTKEVFNKVGEFDTVYYPAYYEDDDYFARIKMNKISYQSINQLRYQEIEVSGSIKKDPTLNSNFYRNREIYLEKWGSKKNPWSHPYNIESFDDSDDDIFMDYISKL